MRSTWSGTRTAPTRWASALGRVRTSTACVLRRTAGRWGPPSSQQLSDNPEMLASYNFSRLLERRGPWSPDRLGTSGDFDNAVQRYEDGIATLISRTSSVAGGLRQSQRGRPREVQSWLLARRCDGLLLPPPEPTPVQLLATGLQQLHLQARDSRATPRIRQHGPWAALAMKIAAQVDVILQIFNVLNSLDVAGVDSRALDADGEVAEGSRGGAVFASRSTTTSHAASSSACFLLLNRGLEEQDMNILSPISQTGLGFCLGSALALGALALPAVSARRPASPSVTSTVSSPSASLGRALPSRKRPKQQRQHRDGLLDHLRLSPDSRTG